MKTWYKGWECPKCRAIYSPYVTKCDKCSVGSVNREELRSSAKEMIQEYNKNPERTELIDIQPNKDPKGLLCHNCNGKGTKDNNGVNSFCNVCEGTGYRK